jgi:hypothetical protein
MQSDIAGHPVQVKLWLNARLQPLPIAPLVLRASQIQAAYLSSPETGLFDFFRMRFQHPQGFWIKSEKPGRGNGNDDDILSQSIAVKRYFLI